ncbi:CBS domain-containing protein [Devosia sp. PTR5]|uniref:CBS domain-containing protein n=1 Tax=Devosia oryzisoli TaxID=2774138 RepID=A0A927FSV5_9HYPH|nr:CBS domain-containing protein [Devosia oryzisoli]MBD8064807.1 CBS domain-containing protein [Devosia oryzisoli]
MNVEALAAATRQKLVTISSDAPLIEAAKVLKSGLDLVVVCNAEHQLVGVVSKTDVVERISSCQGSSCTCAVATVMTTDVLTCGPGDSVTSVWEIMRARAVKNVPVVDVQRHPAGLLTAGDALQALLNETSSEEQIMRDYVMGFGYR